MVISEHQIKGIIAVSIILAIIPFISFIMSSQRDLKSPVLSTSGSNSLIIEVVEENGGSGIAFVDRGTSVNRMLAQLAYHRMIKEDIQLQNGMKIRIVSEKDHQGFIVEKIDAVKRLALGLPLDINLASLDELILIPGVGDAMAANIVEQREKIGRFERIDQLMNIKGIKEKKLSKLRPYFYVEKWVR